MIELLSDPAVREQYVQLPDEQRALFEWRARWLMRAHKFQIEPAGDWAIWLMLGGRGSGKTRTSAETIGWWAATQANTRWLVSAPTSSDLKGVCFEGDSGLIKIIPPILVTKYNSSLHEIHLTNGSLIKGIPASEPDRFRGPQFHGGWCCIRGTRILLPDSTTKAIENIQAGDTVMTRYGPRRVLTAGVSNNPNELVRIGCGDMSLTVTTDHPILVSDQWIPAGELRIGNMLCQVTKRSADDTRTVLCTNNTSGQSHPGGSFITKTKIKETTTPPTYKQCRADRTNDCTQLVRPDAPRNATRLLSRLKHFALQSLRHANNALQSLYPTRPMKLAHSAAEIAEKSGGVISSCLRCVTVSCALRSTPQSNSSNGIAANDATLSQQYAPIALTQTEVLSVERLPNDTTYNLMVEGEHEFIANGIVVHNCDELAAWDYLQDSWDMIQFGIRLGSKTRMICSTTPKPKPVIMDLLDREGDDVVVTKASTYVNIANLAPAFQKQILQYEGTNLGRQEIHAEIIDPEEGGIVKRDWFKLWPNGKQFPKFEFIVQSLDCATSEKTVNDPTAHITLGIFKPEDGGMCAMVIDCWQEHLQYPDLRPKVLDEYETVYGEGREKKRVDLLLIEDKSAGIQLIQDLRRAGIPVIPYNPGRADKIQRLSIVANIIKAGRVWIPESGNKRGFVRDWAEGMVSQICSFPEGAAHDDFVDAMSQALRYLRDSGWLTIDFPKDWVDEEDYIDAGRRSVDNPYSL